MIKLVAFLSTKPIKAENELKTLVFSFFCAFLDFFPFNFSILGAKLGAAPSFVLTHRKRSKRKYRAFALPFLESRRRFGYASSDELT